MSTIIQLEQLHEVAFRSPIVEGNYNGLSSARRKAFGSIDSFWRYRPGKALALSTKESSWLHLPAVLSVYGNCLHSTAILCFATSLTSTVCSLNPVSVRRLCVVNSAPFWHRQRGSSLHRRVREQLATGILDSFISSSDMINFTLLFPRRRRRLRDRCSFTFQSPVSVCISVTSIRYRISLPNIRYRNVSCKFQALYRWKEDRMFEGAVETIRDGDGTVLGEGYRGYSKRRDTKDRAKTFLSFPLVRELSLSFWGSGAAEC
ncbi:hypothetical protein C8J56DRAFT_33099 [Mycena floridula]|nr:hypothetical protein C8J56DRAFT_33099 [Mycena floridula]